MKVKGVNLGNWLVLEKWMNPALFEGTTAEDEYWLPRQLSREVYEARIKIHRSEYITERDFAAIKSWGLNAVRIPVPYFIFGDREPFIGCVEELDKAFIWAEHYGLKILIDLHTAPESQNGYDNGGICGVCKWAKNPEEVEFELTVLERLAQRYGTREGLWGIEVLNEPALPWIYGIKDISHTLIPFDKSMAEENEAISYEFLRKFYLDAYDRMRKYLPEEKFIVISDGFEPRVWKDFMREEKYKNVVLDIHEYLKLAEKLGCEQKLDHYLSYIENNFVKDIKEMSEYFPVICGEWCVFNSLTCGRDTKGGTNIFQEEGEIAPARKVAEEEKKEIYNALAKAQIAAWNNGEGYFYWSYKLMIDTAGEDVWYGWDSWDMGRCMDFGWITPEDL